LAIAAQDVRAVFGSYDIRWRRWIISRGGSQKFSAL
jgi:hypothetical protein